MIKRTYLILPSQTICRILNAINLTLKSTIPECPSETYTCTQLSYINCYYALLLFNINRFWHLPATKNVRLNVAGIHRQPTTDRFENSSSCTSTNPFRTSGPNDLSMPGNRKLANAHPPTTYQAQLSSNVRC